ncbi:hypothetical protein [Mesorhizobium sp. M8A.F.Ca.ET.021.01.1.1]|uniref:hypothetical protein n=1 Tax=Mesorhizobium sp. M8A.F.Ca.ET.021.01.1.1 TaxID=2496757 RepID=UPI000FCAAE7F|nr:hypothetical protein [Mesorhizobium sp. M8A.F.Ca.ET.021.01.1.1]RUW56377.1 hypothetical protein EOA36_04520 [Mesorhizobium sp. M8A.F.Ca.ET.021.01.1.1]
MAKYPELVSFPVFKDAMGNRFVFPGVYKGSQDWSAPTLWAYCRQMEVALGVTQEAENFEIKCDEGGGLTFPHVPASAGSRGFAHGSAQVWIISGPTFDEISAETMYQLKKDRADG